MNNLVLQYDTEREDYYIIVFGELVRFETPSQYILWLLWERSVLVSLGLKDIGHG